MFRNTNCCGRHNGGVDRLTKICTDRVTSTLTTDNWYELYALGKRTRGLLCQHAKEQVMRFMATNLTKLDNAAELTIEDLETVLKRSDLNCTTKELLLFLYSASAFKSLPDNQKVDLLDACMTRKPAEVLLVGGGQSQSWRELESMEVFNYLSNTWSRVPSVNFPMPLAWMEMEMINNVVFTVGGCGRAPNRERGEER